MSGDRRRSRGAASRQVQAFESLLAPDDSQADQAGSAGPRRRRSSGRGQGSRGGRPILLREEQPPSMAAGNQTGSAALRQLQELFGQTFPGDVIEEVFQACGGSAEAAVEALFALSTPAPAGAEPQPSCAAAGEPAANPDIDPGAPAPPCYWDWLPEEVKDLVLGMLSVRDLARAAGACRELAGYVRQQRQRKRSVALPEGVSMRAVRGAVAAFGAAPALSLARWASQLRWPNQFEDVFAAVALGEADRATGVPVRHVDLSRCGGLTDGDLGMVCSTLRHLASLDLSRCSQLTDDCLATLARYTRDQEEWDEWEEEGQAGVVSFAGEEDLLPGGGGSGGLAGDLVEGLAVMALKGSARAGAGAGIVAGAGEGPASPSTAVKRLVEAREAARAAARGAAGPPPGGLRQLRLRETGVTSRGLRALLQGQGAAVRSLELLDVSGCRGVGPEGFALGKSALRTLRAAGCLQLRSVVLQLPPSAPLEHLDLANCRQLQEVTVAATQLQRLTLSHCGVLASVSLQCRALEELRCVNCSHLATLGPEFDCPSLRHLDLFGCRLMDAEGLEAGAASFGRLSHLSLGGCTSLSRLLLPEQAPALASVDVTGCGVVRQVVLGSRVLQSFTAKACTRLVEVRLHSQVLRRLDLENCCHLREVVLPGTPAVGNPGTRPDDGHQGPLEHLVLKGCTSLPPQTKRRLTAAFPAY